MRVITWFEKKSMGGASIARRDGSHGSETRNLPLNSRDMYSEILKRNRTNGTGKIIGILLLTLDFPKLPHF